ncbi:inorganic triphosphatase [uncultured Shewanella sp.]|uniref:CYTH domain-containing protein n=1 Tax=uncultured Shewanella sp. TaxID=173975 RepID=UPI00262459F2|nr:CYTH domain-containing protein [uncultured Shewanella sp.]
MATEIELKLLFQQQNKKSIIELFNHLNDCEAKPLVTLKNKYFDTPGLQLRHWDMGLRIRQVGSKREQTIKTAGTVVGGVHNRPEFNVNIEQDFPNLVLFPCHIWPSNAQVSFVNNDLQCLFSTDFQRLCWHISWNNSLIEVALDVGSIYIDELNESICELELELISGSSETLITLAEYLLTKIPMRFGQSSKAKRGYALAAKAGIIRAENRQQLSDTEKLAHFKEQVSLMINQQDSASYPVRVHECLTAGLANWLALEEALGEEEISDSVSRYQLFQQHLKLLQIVFSYIQGLSDEGKAMFEQLIEAIDEVSFDDEREAEQQQNETNDLIVSAKMASLFSHTDYGNIQLILLNNILKSEDFLMA